MSKIYPYEIFHKFNDSNILVLTNNKIFDRYFFIEISPNFLIFMKEIKRC